MTLRALIGKLAGLLPATHHSSIVEGNTANARALVDLFERELAASGFDKRRRTTLWRRTNVKYDILQFDVIPKWRCAKWGVPYGSFRLDVSCLFPFLPRPGYPQDEVDRPDKGFGQVRLSVTRGIRQRRVRATNIWWAADDAEVMEAVVADVRRVIVDKALPFFSRFDDTEELLRTFLEDDDAIDQGERIWGFGKMGSPVRLLYTGFTALECGKWSLAMESLHGCREVVMSIDDLPSENIGNIQAEFSPLIDEGLACAEQRHPWRTGLD
jgi:hypothetical protein